MRNKSILILTVLLITAPAALQYAASQKPKTPPVPDADIIRDIEYIPEGHQRNKLDLYLPKNAPDSKPLPLIVWVHGGAWLGGSKDNCPALRFLKQGYAVASINYRLSQHAIFPAQIQDCKAAIRCLRANAKKYKLDAERIGACCPNTKPITFKKI